jgi:hypothetical protein
MKEKILNLGYFVGIFSIISVVAFGLLLFTVTGLHIDINELQIVTDAESLIVNR